MNKLTHFPSDMIIVLNQGEVVEQGTHQELLEKGGLYYAMWIEQAMDTASTEYPTESLPEGNQETGSSTSSEQRS